MTARVHMTVLAAVATLLASLSLSAVFKDGQWFWQVVSAVAVAAAGCALGRRMGLPRLLVPVIGLAALGLLLTWVYARDVAVLGILPGPGALRALAELAQQGADATRRYAAPAPTDPGLVLLAAAGVGFVAVVVDTLAVTYRSAALAGVPLLVLYAVPVTVVREGVPWLLFLVGALGWLALLLAEGRERVSAWGRALDRRSNRGDNLLAGTPPEPLGVVGRRIGAAALGLALVLPAVLPWVTSSLFDRGGGSGAGSSAGGSSTVTTVNPFVTLIGDLTAKQDSVVLQYQSTDQTPDYLRMVTLDRFDGTTWQPADMERAGPATTMPPSGDSSQDGHDVTTHIRINGLSQQWLPMPYPATKVSDLKGGWLYDAATRNVYTVSGNSFGASYTVDSRHPELTADELRGAAAPPPDIADRYTKLPKGIPAEVVQEARRVTTGATTAYDKAFALQQYFAGAASKFEYSTKLDDFTGNPLVAFLFQTRKGYCQQFSSAFAVMAREVGLPTRIDVGFTPGQQSTPGQWDVSRTNAHAWPEVYFGGIGWVRFEPTKNGPAGVGTPQWAPGGLGDRNNNQTGGLSATQAEHNAQRAGEREEDVPSTAPSAAPTSTPTTSSSVRWAPIAAAVLVVALAAPGTARLVRRRRRLRSGRRGVEPRERVLAAWRELADSARDVGRPWSSSRTPRRAADWVTAGVGDPEAVAAARRLARAVERVRYAPDGIDLAAGNPGADARRVARAMEAVATRRERWRARLWPASVLSAAARHAADLLDLVDVAGARIRQAVLRLVPRRGGAEAG